MLLSPYPGDNNEGWLRGRLDKRGFFALNLTHRAARQSAYFFIKILR